MTEVETHANVSVPASRRPPNGGTKEVTPTLAVRALLVVAPEASFLHRLARACAAVQKLSPEDRRVVYGDPDGQELSGGHRFEDDD